MNKLDTKIHSFHIQRTCSACGVRARHGKTFPEGECISVARLRVEEAATRSGWVGSLCEDCAPKYAPMSQAQACRVVGNQIEAALRRGCSSREAAVLFWRALFTRYRIGIFPMVRQFSS